MRISSNSTQQSPCCSKSQHAKVPNSPANTDHSPQKSKNINLSCSARRTYWPYSFLLVLISLFSPVNLIEWPERTVPPTQNGVRAPTKLFQGCPAELMHNAHSFRNIPLTCRVQPSLAIVAYEGLLDAMEHCREEMRFQVWDCSQPGTLLNTPTLLRFGTRESAYLWAMSAAGVAWGVAQACAQGWLEECKCVTTPPQKGQYLTGNDRPADGGTGEWEWGGCSYGVQYGVITSRKLLTRSGNGKSQLKKLEKHNLKTGRLAVKKTLISSCKCHGVSGSCQQRTCWKKTSDMGSIAKHLTEKYRRAKQLLIDLQKPKSSDLVFLEKSPDSCSQLQYEIHQKRSLPRICNWRNETHSDGSCNDLCCGQGYTVSHEVVSYKCDCKFIWCCKLECNDCLSHRWVSTCNN